MSEQILITGGYGCIGAETAKWVIRNTDADVLVSSRSVSDERTERVFFDIDRDRLRTVAVDVQDRRQIEKLLDENEVDRVAHLAALQTPDCDANRDLGMQINLGGTQNLIEAMKSSRSPIKRFVFASSIAVYGPRADYPPGRVPMLVEPKPVNVYGAWKQAGEHLSRFFCVDTGIPTLSLRPGVLFGPGRDAGLTSTPTTAIKHVAKGQPYEIPFRSRQDYQYAPDVGAAFAHALIEPFDGYGIFTLPGKTADTQSIVSELHAAADDLGILDRFAITVGDDEVPFICDLQDDVFGAHFPRVVQTPLTQAIQDSLRVFLDQVERGWL